MNVLLVSQCDKRALTETRRILDQFAERRGDRTWQTPITQAGLDTLRRLLRKTARKNTAVACHWIRGLDHSELLWTVGAANRFNADGAVPTNTTKRNVLRAEDENDWHTLETIRLLAGMAALWHDVGKANDVFAAKLTARTRPPKDPYRHEWVSFRLFQAFVGKVLTDTDDDWLKRLVEGDFAALESKRALYRDGIEPLDGPSPPTLAGLPPIARAVGWLVLTHHRLPISPVADSLGPSSLSDLLQAIDADWCGSSGADVDETPAKFSVRLRSVWSFSKGLPHISAEWRKRVAKLAKSLAAHRAAHGTDWLRANPFVAHIARMSLMLADHHYSSLPPDDTRRLKFVTTYDVYANTDKEGRLKQRLDEHLIGVEQAAHRIVQMLPRLEKDLPRLTRAKGFAQRTADPAFAWQNKAFDLAVALAEVSQVQGFFGVNMASTGTGKTLGNGRIAYGLADPIRGARFSVALGLRTLTLQTGLAFRERLKLDDDALAVLVGGAAVRQLFERDRKAHKAAADYALSKGSASAEVLLQDDGYVVYEGALSEGPLSDWLTQSGGAGGRQNNAQKLVEAPVLVCTVDHLMPAVESTRGGHQIAPMLRLLSSDLVLDEVDDFGMEDLPALARLTYWAGLLGSRVLLSSATLPPALVQGLFAAYLAGRSAYQINRGNVNISGALGPSIVCAWFDEFGCVSSQHSDETSLRAAHDVFVQVRVQKLVKLPARRRAAIVPMDAGFTSQGKAWSTPQLFVTRVRAQALALHKINAQIDDTTKASVSFGLIRMANISPLWQVAQMLLQAGAMAKEDTHIHLCVYHSRHPLLVRSRIESVLDTVLRRDPNDPQAIFRHDDVRLALQQSTAKNHIFIVLATAVAEVGRDHDYDWAVVEPSSMRSLIQLAGRVRRHRPQLFEANNISVLDFNWQGLKNPGTVSFQRPGFEKSGHFALATHQLSALVDMQTLTTISAKPRILQPAVLSAKTSLADLEHARLSALLLVSGEKVEMNIRQFWDASAHLTGHEQQINRFRKRNSNDSTFAFVPGDDDSLHFMREQEGQWTSADAQHLQPPVELRVGAHINMWPIIDLATEIDTLASELGISAEDCAKRFATVELAVIQGDKPVVWKYAPELGFTRAS